jgi:hypothetical protein
VFSSLEHDVMEYREAMAVTPLQDTDELLARILGQLSLPAVVELTTWVASANLATRCNTELGIES